MTPQAATREANEQKKVYYSLSIRRNGRKIKMIKIELSREGLEINVSGIELIVYAEAGK